MGDRTTAQVLDAPMGKNDARATTVRGFLVALLRRLWEDGEDFSGKRPFGNSGWQYAIHDAVLGPDASSVDTDPIILAAIDSLGAPPNLTAVLSALPHLTGDELRRVAEAMPRVAGEWEHRERWGQRTEDGHYDGSIVAEWEHYENRHQAADAEEWDWTAERPVLARTVDVNGTPIETWHETPRAAQAACDARLEAAGVRLCGEVVRDG